MLEHKSQAKFDAANDGRYMKSSIADGKSAFGCWKKDSCVHVTCYQGLMGAWACPNPHNNEVVDFVKQKYAAGMLIASKNICVPLDVFNDRQMWSDPAPPTDTKSSMSENPSSSAPAKTEQKVQSMDNTWMFCRWCDSYAKLRCGRCQKARYCSAECQAKHWPKHKLMCFKDETPVTKSDADHKEPAAAL